MKKVLIAWAILATSLLANAQVEMHDAKVMTILQLGNKDVSIVKDMITECTYKSSPHDRGDYIINEDVTLEFENGEENPDIVKPGCNNKKCFNQGCNDVFNPQLNSNIDYSKIHVRDKDFTGENGSDKILVFEDEATLLNTVDELKRLVETKISVLNKKYGNLSEDELIEKVRVIGFNEEQPIRVFNNKMQFMSLYEKLENDIDDFLKSEEDDWTNYPEHFFPGAGEISTINTDAEVQIGNKIYKYNEDGTYFEISDGDLISLKEINDGTVDLNLRNNVILHNPNEPLNGPATCKTNKSEKDYENRYGGFRLYYKAGIYNWYPFYTKTIYARTKVYRYVSGSYRKAWINIGAGIYTTYPGCAGPGSASKGYDGQIRHSIIATDKKNGGWKSISGVVIGRHWMHNLSVDNVITW